MNQYLTYLEFSSRMLVQGLYIPVRPRRVGSADL